MIKNLKDIPRYLDEKNSDHRSRVQSIGGAAFYYRALVAQILLLSFISFFVAELMPADSVLFSYGFIFIVGLIIQRFWGYIKNKLPPAHLALFSGDFFYECEVGFLNRSIFGIMLGHIGLLLMPPLWLKQDKTNLK